MTLQSAQTVVCPSCGTINRVPAARIAAGATPSCGACGAAMFDGEPVTIDSAQVFERHIQRGSLPVVVDFWAEWCGPCRAMAPQFAAVARALGPRVRMLKVDAEALPALAGRLAIRSLPSILLFHGGREIARHVGLVSAATLRDWIVERIDGPQRRAS